MRYAGKMTPASGPERLKSELEHARWRVSFLLALLDSHRRLAHKWEGEWRQKEIGYIRQIAEAQVELDHIEREQNLNPPGAPPRS